MYYVNERWLGGMLTNFKTIQGRINRLKDIERMSEDGTFAVLPKKEVIAIKKEWEKLEKNLGGIKDMKKVPDAIFVVEGVNVITKHQKPNAMNPQGGIVNKEASIHISNVMPLDPETGKGTRVRFEMKDGKKVRVAVKSGKEI